MRALEIENEKTSCCLPDWFFLKDQKLFIRYKNGTKMDNYPKNENSVTLM